MVGRVVANGYCPSPATSEGLLCPQATNKCVERLMQWGEGALEDLIWQRSYLDQPSHALKLFCSCLFLFSLPCPGWAGCSLRTASGRGFVSVIISIVICPLSDCLPGQARKHPSVSVFDGAPSSSSLEKTKAKQAHTESDVSLLTSPLISPSHFSHRPISAFSLLFVWDVACAQHPGESGRLLSESAGVQRWVKLIGLLWPPLRPQTSARSLAS